MIDELDRLVLDDIGAEYVKANEYGYESWASDGLYKVFDMRLNKSIICSTNYSEKILTDKYGKNRSRIIDRMMDLAKAIRLEGERYRRSQRFLMRQGMKSVIVFESKDSQEETERKWAEWNEHKSAVGDKYVPTAEETKKRLIEQERPSRRYA